MLADTPGIGENEFLETYLMDFISNNEILGFIYIIFSDAAGGVQQDRVSEPFLKSYFKQQISLLTITNKAITKYNRLWIKLKDSVQQLRCSQMQT